MKPGDAVRITEAFKAELKRHGYYRERQDGQVGTLRMWVTPNVADIRFDYRPCAGGRLLHRNHIELA